MKFMKSDYKRNDLVDVDELGNEYHFFLCNCENPEHTLRVCYDHKFNACELEILLATKPLFERVWLGIRYIFGYRSKYGYFSSMSVNPLDCDRLIKLFTRMKNRDKEMHKEDKEDTANNYDSRDLDI